MRNFTSLLALLAGSAAFAQAVVTGPYLGQSSAPQYDQYYNRKREITVTGNVVGKVKGSVPGRSQSVSLIVRGPKKVQYQVDLGPAWYVQNQRAPINVGDRVRVTGNLLRLQKNEQVLIPRQIVRGRQVLTLRDNSGNPYYSAFRKGRVTIRNTRDPIQGTITSMGSYDVNGETLSGVTLNTENGPVNVALAPDWFLRAQQAQLATGQALTIYPAAGPLVLPGNVIIAGGAYTGGGTLVFRPDGGVSAWSGFQPYVGGF